jgi:sterol desaturase/sphingolipid hydroxylase (fatty acid hydroxylase superfamily)
MHKAPILWRVHRVHHSDTQMDVLTTVRSHPFEFLLMAPVHIAGALALGIPPAAVMIYDIIDGGMAVFTHANIRLRPWLERSLRWVIVTPDMHRVHHSAHQPETDSNYSVGLSFWDRLFGTFRMCSGARLSSMPPGLGECQDRRSRPLLWLLLLPFKGAVIASAPDSPENPNALQTV